MDGDHSEPPSVDVEIGTLHTTPPPLPSEYHGLLERAHRADLNDLFTRDFVRLAGTDRHGRPTFLLLGAHLPPATPENWDRVMQVIALLMDPIASSTPYTLVYVHTDLTAENQPPTRWLVRTYRMLPRFFKKNLKSLHIVHPSAVLRLVLTVFSPFLSDRFWHKLHNHTTLEELWLECDRDQLNLPDYVFRYDAKKQEERSFMEEYAQVTGPAMYGSLIPFTPFAFLPQEDE